MLRTSLVPFSRDFDRFAERAPGWGPWLPVQPGMPMDAVRRENDIVLSFDLPGVDAGSIDVTVDQGVLTVRAQRTQERAEGDSPFIRERVTGTFARRLRLSDAVDADQIEAGYHDGVLTVRVPLAEQAKPRKVEIAVEGTKSLTA
jgi:HSP20 family protein